MFQTGDEAPHPLDSQYSLLKCGLEHVKPATKDFQVQQVWYTHVICCMRHIIHRGQDIIQNLYCYICRDRKLQVKRYSEMFCHDNDIKFERAWFLHFLEPCDCLCYSVVL